MFNDKSWVEGARISSGLISFCDIAEVHRMKANTVNKMGLLNISEYYGVAIARHPITLAMMP
jgi:hypothetical protein